MKRVGDLFEKYRLRFKAPQATVEKACVRAIAEVTGYTVREDQVTYTVHTQTLSLQVPSVLKSELRFAQDDILAALERELGETNTSRTIL
jgi:ADP-ribose pyrophosphatase YjhB (NUDIX family)